jgi:hypothetical protein
VVQNYKTKTLNNRQYRRKMSATMPWVLARRNMLYRKELCNLKNPEESRIIFSIVFWSLWKCWFPELNREEMKMKVEEMVNYSCS